MASPLSSAGSPGSATEGEELAAPRDSGNEGELTDVEQDAPKRPELTPEERYERNRKLQRFAMEVTTYWALTILVASLVGHVMFPQRFWKLAFWGWFSAE